MAIRHAFAALSATGVTGGIQTLIGPSEHAAPVKDHTVEVVTTGTPSAATLQLEGSLDGSNWYALSAAMDVSSSTMFHVLDAPVAFIQGNLVSLTGGSSPTVTMTYLGGKQ